MSVDHTKIYRIARSKSSERIPIF